MPQQKIKAVLQPPWHVILLAIVLLVFVGFVVGFLLSARVELPIGCIADVEIVGPISFDNNVRELAALIREADGRHDVRGILISINSGGGSAVAAKELFRAVRDTTKPTWIYIRDAALSGGYLAAVGADQIWADSASLTGSIGVRATVVDISPFLEKVGVNTTTIKSGELKDFADVLKPLTPKEREILQGIVDELFGEFKEIVLTARRENPRFSMEKFNESLDGRILTGRGAYEIGLIDELGSYSDALTALGVESGLGEEPAVCEFRLKRDLLSLIFGALGEGIGKSIAGQFRGREMSIYVG